jgi:hypothetical protein
MLRYFGRLAAGLSTEKVLRIASDAKDAVEKERRQRYISRLKRNAALGS